MEQKKIFRRNINILSGLVFISLGCNIILSVISGFAIIFADAGFIEEPDPFWSGTILTNAIFIPVYSLIIFLFACLIMKTTPKTFVHTSKGNKTKKILAVFISLGAAMILNVVFSYFYYILELLGFQLADWNAAMTLPSDTAGWIAYAFVVAVLPAIFEESVFRGVILGTLKKQNAPLAIIVSALLFGFFHGNITQIPFAFCLGLIFGYFAVKFDSIAIPMIAHFLNNLISCAAEYFMGQPGANAESVDSFFIYVPIVIGTIALIIYLIFSRKEAEKRDMDENTWAEEKPRYPLDTKNAFRAAVSAPVLWCLMAVYTVLAFYENYVMLTMQ